LLDDDPIEETVEFHHAETYPLDENGQGDAHLQFAFSAHRAVADVDVGLGLVRVVELATTQEVGKAMNPQALDGQIDGGTAQGLGLALLEEIQLRDGQILNASFTDYLLPTILDMPPVRKQVLEHPDPEAPYGLKGVGEPPNISTPPAVVAALRDATGRELPRIPVRPEQLAGVGEQPPSRSLTPEEAGALDEDAFVLRFGGVYEHSPWVARGAWRRRPFSAFDDFAGAFEAAVREASDAALLALVRAHPELAGREARVGELTDESASEQAAAGLDRLSHEEAVRLRELNRAYGERFGFPLVIAVRQRDKASILAYGEMRLHNGREQELETAIGEIVKIARLRLRELVTDSDRKETT
jgi:OHCU decarboxylase